MRVLLGGACAAIEPSHACWQGGKQTSDQSRSQDDRNLHLPVRVLFVVYTKYFIVKLMSVLLLHVPAATTGLLSVS